MHRLRNRLGLVLLAALGLTTSSSSVAYAFVEFAIPTANSGPAGITAELTETSGSPSKPRTRSAGSLRAGSSPNSTFRQIGAHRHHGRAGWKRVVHGPNLVE